MTRMLVVMGSGETSPTMVKTHREVFARLEADGGAPVPAVLLDTPFGFQENADDIAARAVAYFADSVGRPIEVASFGRWGGDDRLGREAAMAAVARAHWVFAGPGSPTYSLRRWTGTEIPALLADKLRHGGVVTFASAAALTLGLATVPVYEIYKSGADPSWAPGLDLLTEVGMPVAVIPHYDNAEGGHHDTRFCYLGERRLAVMEHLLPDDAFILGVDEHTGCLLDLDAGTATVVGLGGVTVRRHGQSSVVTSGTSVGIDALVAMAMGKGPVLAVPVLAVGAQAAPARAATPLLATIRRHEETFDAAVAVRDVDAAVGAVLELDAALLAWGADTLQSDEQDRGRGARRRMIVKLGALAKQGARDPRDIVGPYIDGLLSLRETARAARRFADADSIRDRLVDLGVEIRDTPDGTEWHLTNESDGLTVR